MTNFFLAESRIIRELIRNDFIDLKNRFLIQNSIKNILKFYV